MNKKKLLEGSVFRALLYFAIPIFISNLFQQLYNTVDIWIVGNLLGEHSLAAIGASTPIYDLLIGFAFGIGNGLSICVARCFGSGDEKMLRKSVAAALVIGVFVSIGITIIAQTCISPVLRYLETPVEILAESKSYILTITLFSTIMIFFNLLSRILTAVGNSVMPMLFLMFSATMNIILDYIFIAFLHLGVRGAAIATVTAQMISVLLCIFYIARYCKEIIPHGEDFNVSLPMYLDMTAQGFSAGFMSSLVNSGTVILQSGINGLGTAIIAGHTTARRIFSFCSMPFYSMSNALMTFVSQNIGAKRYDRIKKALHDGTIYDIILMILMTIFLFIFAPMISQWLSGSDNPRVIWYSATYLRFGVVFYFVLGELCNLRLTLQGLGQKILPLVSSIIELIGKIAFVILFIPIFHEYAVIACEPLIWCAMLAQLMWAYRKVSRSWPKEV